MSVPLLAANNISDITLLQSTVLSLVDNVIWQLNRDATPVNLAAALACRPSLLMIVSDCLTMVH